VADRIRTASYRQCRASELERATLDDSLSARDVRTLPPPTHKCQNHAMAKFNLRAYARSGAEARVAELKAELREIFRMFPDLEAGRRGGQPRDAQSASPAPAKRRRRTMTPEQRNAVSVRMAKYWAQRRAAKGAKKR